MSCTLDTPCPAHAPQDLTKESIFAVKPVAAPFNPLAYDRLGNKRSGHWPAVRTAWLTDHPTCAGCGGAKDPEVHHKIAFHLDPSKELDPHNFITLCEHPGRDCHFREGHFFDWSDINPHVVVHAAAELERIQRHAGHAHAAIALAEPEPSDPPPPTILPFVPSDAPA